VGPDGEKRAVVTEDRRKTNHGNNQRGPRNWALKTKKAHKKYWIKHLGGEGSGKRGMKAEKRKPSTPMCQQAGGQLFEAGVSKKGTGEKGLGGGNFRQTIEEHQLRLRP